jgi:hypothetical protein
MPSVLISAAPSGQEVTAEDSPGNGKTIISAGSTIVMNEGRGTGSPSGRFQRVTAEILNPLLRLVLLV